MSANSGKIASISVPLEINPMWVTAYRKYFRLWVRLAKTIRISEDDAKDIVHGVISSLLSDSTKSFQSLDHIRNYVARSVLNRAIQSKRRGERKTPWMEHIELRFPVVLEETVDDDYLTHALKSAIQRLPRRDFDVIKLRYYAGYTFDEISRILGTPISTLKSREEAALQRLERWLRKKGL